MSTPAPLPIAFAIERRIVGRNALHLRLVDLDRFRAEGDPCVFSKENIGRELNITDLARKLSSRVLVETTVGGVNINS
jgi:hypothetical protein